MSIILFYTPKITSRIQFVTNFIFKDVLHVDFELTDDFDFFCSQETVKLSYATNPNEKAHLHFPSNGLLFQTEIIDRTDAYTFNTRAEIEEAIRNQTIDAFATIFFYLSRYEEYVNANRDRHGRFLYEYSIVTNPEIPIVDVIVETLRQAINTHMGREYISKPSFQLRTTYDIDFARAYQWKGTKRLLGGLAKAMLQLNMDEVSHRIQTSLGLKKDVYDTFDKLEQWHQQYGHDTIYFWLLGDYGLYDKNIPHLHPKFRAEIQAIAGRYSVGIHPSYASFERTEMLPKEIHRLQEITNQQITKNRFHFLRFQLPHSYSLLLEQGITDDYSMAYADRVGFRAGTANSFYWYDLEREQQTNLRIHPFQIMDVTLKNYMKLNVRAAWERSQAIMEEVQQNGGTVTLLWHNSSFDWTWEGWQELYQSILATNS